MSLVYHFLEHGEHVSKKLNIVQLLDTCRKKSIFDSGYRRHVEGSVHTAATCRILHVDMNVHM